MDRLPTPVFLGFLSWWLRICLQCGRPRFDPWVGKIPWRRKWQPIPVLLPGEFHGGRSLASYSPWGHKESDMTERLTHVKSVIRFPGDTRVQSLGQEDLPEEGMATHSSILAWKIPWTEEPSRLWSMGSPRVGHNLVTKQQQQFTKKVIVVQLLRRV